MNESTSTERLDAIRAGLIAHVAESRPRRRIGWAAGLVAVGALAGVGVSAGAFAATEDWRAAARGGGGIVIEHPAGQPTPDMDGAVAAPPGVIPGAPLITVIGDPVAATIAADTRLSLTIRPEAATHVRVTVACLTAGTIRWGTSPDGNNPSSSCSVGEAGSATASAWMDLPLDASTSTLFVSPGPGAEASVTLQYVTYVATLLGVNARGESYGVDASNQGRPDLIAVATVNDDGLPLQGYVRAVDLEAPPQERSPDSPDDAVRWTAEMDAKYPNGWDAPVFESDGTTQIGTFRIGR